MAQKHKVIADASQQMPLNILIINSIIRLDKKTAKSAQQLHSDPLRVAILNPIAAEVGGVEVSLDPGDDLLTRGHVVAGVVAD